MASTRPDTITRPAGEVGDGTTGIGGDVGVGVFVSVGVLVGVLVGVTVGVFVGVSVGVCVGVIVGVFVGVSVGVSVGVGVAVGVSVGVFVGVAVGVFVGVFVGVSVGVSVGVLVGVAVGVSVGVLVGVLVGVAVGVSVGVLVGVLVGVAVGVSVGVAVGVSVGVSVGVLVGVGVGSCTVIRSEPWAPPWTPVSMCSMSTRASVRVCPAGRALALGSLSTLIVKSMTHEALALPGGPSSIGAGGVKITSPVVTSDTEIAKLTPAHPMLPTPTAFTEKTFKSMSGPGQIPPGVVVEHEGVYLMLLSRTLPVDCRPSDRLVMVSRRGTFTFPTTTTVCPLGTAAPPTPWGAAKAGATAEHSATVATRPARSVCQTRLSCAESE